MPRPSVAFMANYNETYLFESIASRIATQAIDVCWIVVTRKRRDFLVEKCGAASLHLRLADARHIREPLDDYRINELIYGNRVLRGQTV